MVYCLSHSLKSVSLTYSFRMEMNTDKHTFEFSTLPGLSVGEINKSFASVQAVSKKLSRFPHIQNGLVLWVLMSQIFSVNCQLHHRNSISFISLYFQTKLLLQDTFGFVILLESVACMLMKEESVNKGSPFILTSFYLTIRILVLLNFYRLIELRGQSPSHSIDWR